MLYINLYDNLLCSGKNCFKDNSFINSLSQDNILHLSYNGLGTEQNPNIIYPFNSLISLVKPSRVLEIGTFAGGLTLIIRTILNNNNLLDSIVVTYDINEPTYLIPQLVNFPNTFSYVENIFSNCYSQFNNETISQKIISFIQQEGVTLVLCDGGCKKCEFNILSSYLKNNDIIMAHDYAPNKEYFDQHMYQKQWNWHEIQDSDIEYSIQNNHLKPFMYEEFLSVAWLCMIKQEP